MPLTNGHPIATRSVTRTPRATGAWRTNPAPKAITTAPKAAGSRISGTGHATPIGLIERTPSGGTALFTYGPGGRWTLVAVQADAPRASIPSGKGGSGGSSGQLVAQSHYSSGVTTGGGPGQKIRTPTPTYYEPNTPITVEPGATAPIVAPKGGGTPYQPVDVTRFPYTPGSPGGSYNYYSTLTGGITPTPAMTEQPNQFNYDFGTATTMGGLSAFVGMTDVVVGGGAPVSNEALTFADAEGGFSSDTSGGY